MPEEHISTVVSTSTTESIDPVETTSTTEPITTVTSTSTVEPTSTVTSTSTVEPMAKPPNKNMRIAAIIGAVIIMLALIACGIVVVNFMDENALKEQIRNDLANDPAITELSLPGQWTTETGFKVTETQINKLSHAPFSDQASAQIFAVLDNTLIEGQNQYVCTYHKQDGQWTLDTLETLSDNYGPIASIPHEAIVEHLPEIIAETDRMNADEGVYPVDIASFFGEGTTAEVTANNLVENHNETDLIIKTVRDGQEYTGALTLDFFWEALPDVPAQWKLQTAEAGDDTYAAIGSVPHEGISPYVADTQQADLNRAVAWDEFYTRYWETIFVENGSPYAWIGFINIPHNTVDMEYALTLDETGEVLYQSPRLAPNQYIDTAKLPRQLAEGTYQASVTITVYEPGTNRLTSLNSKTTEPITIVVKNALL